MHIHGPHRTLSQHCTKQVAGYVDMAYWLKDNCERGCLFWVYLSLFWLDLKGISPTWEEVKVTTTAV